MKIHFDGGYQEITHLRYIAAYRYSEDRNLWTFRAETLFQIPDGGYLLRTDYRLGPRYKGAKVGKNVFTHRYRRIHHPEIWLLTHGHECLAAYMFPEIRHEVEMDCIFYDDDEKNYRGETFYGDGEAKGETFRDNLPI